jgi:hypothetical protein
MANHRKKEYIEKLAHALVLNPVGERHLAMFSAYLDESGKGHDKTFLAIGGLVSSALQWGKLERDWNQWLLRLHGIPVDELGRPKPFHMSDFVVGNWPTPHYPWPTDKHKDQFLDGLVKIICKRVKCRVYTVVYLKAYHAVFAKDKKKQHPWVLCALGCASRISKWAERHNHDPIPFIFERGGEGWARAYESYCRMEKAGVIGRTKIGSWTMGDKHITGLQATDLWTWELGNHFRSQMGGGHPEIRPSLIKLIHQVEDGSGLILETINLQRMVDDLNNQTSTVEVFPFCAASLPKIILEAL